MSLCVRSAEQNKGKLVSAFVIGIQILYAYNCLFVCVFYFNMSIK